MYSFKCRLGGGSFSVSVERTYRNSKSPQAHLGTRGQAENAKRPTRTNASEGGERKEIFLRLIASDSAESTHLPSGEVRRGTNLSHQKFRKRPNPAKSRSEAGSPFTTSTNRAINSEQGKSSSKLPPPSSAVGSILLL